MRSPANSCGEHRREKPPNLYNMGGSTPRISFWAGFDWLTLNLYIDWCEAWNGKIAGRRNLRELLEDAANAARERGEPVEVEELGGVVHPGGGKIGGVKYCKYKIERADAVILIADAPKYNGDWPNVKIEISGERCLVYDGGAIAAYRSAVNWLGSLGASIHKERVSRADICADFPNLNMQGFYAAYARRWWLCQSRRHHPDFSNGISLYFGATDVVLRIYDKLAEMQASALRGQPAKYEHMIQKRWGGKEPACAVRVEYQLRRDWLKVHGADTVDDLLQRAPDFVGYLTGTTKDAAWFRFLCAKRDDKHVGNNKTLPRWKVVQNAFAEIFQSPEPLIEIDPRNADIETLLKQAFGVLECAACNRGYYVPKKESAAPVKFVFENYDGFEKWFCVMLRNIARDSGRWNLIDEKTARMLRAEMEYMEKSITRGNRDEQSDT